MSAPFDHRALAALFTAFADDPGPAYLHAAGDISFAQLHRRAQSLACRIAGPRSPVLIYGHKEAGYMIAWWACLLAARPLVPVEPDLPPARVAAIAQVCGAGLILQTGAEPAPLDLPCITTDEDVQGPQHLLPVDRAGGDIAYVMFSSGTSGTPKGIAVSYDNLDGFICWLHRDLLADADIQAVSGNVRHCFDVSLFELWTSWLRRVPINALDHAEIINSRRYIARHADHRLGMWVSTPSLAQLYLRDPQFNALKLPDLRHFLFCGEVLAKPLVAELMRRFPEARIINTYGPTECTVAVTGVQITADHLAADAPLPIGRARRGCSLALNASGEIVITGAAVGPGYLGLPDKQARAFPAPGRYLTGDRGWQDDAGLWYFAGRADREVKIQGLRIDLGELEQLLQQQPGIEGAVVEPHLIRGTPRAMNAYLVGPVDPAQIASALAAQLPPALVPRFWFRCADLDVNLNSKLDRSAVIAAGRLAGVAHVHE